MASNMSPQSVSGNVASSTTNVQICEGQQGRWFAPPRCCLWAGAKQQPYLSALLLKLAPNFSQHLLFLLQQLLSVFSCFEHLESCLIHFLQRERSHHAKSSEDVQKILCTTVLICFNLIRMTSMQGSYFCSQVPDCTSTQKILCTAVLTHFNLIRMTSMQGSNFCSQVPDCTSTHVYINHERGGATCRAVEHGACWSVFSISTQGRCAATMTCSTTVHAEIVLTACKHKSLTKSCKVHSTVSPICSVLLLQSLVSICAYLLLLLLALQVSIGFVQLLLSLDAVLTQLLSLFAGSCDLHSALCDLTLCVCNSLQQGQSFVCYRQ